MLKKIILLLTIALNAASAHAAEVNVFTARHYSSDVELYAKFTKQTGIKVNVISGDAKALEKRIVTEGTRSQADVFIDVDAGNLGAAQHKGIFQKISSPLLIEKIPAHLRTDYWYGISKRARIIFYNPEKISETIAKQLNYEDLASTNYKGKIVIRSSSSTYNKSWVASLIENNGTEQTTSWAKALVQNMAREPEGNDRDQILAVAVDKADIAIANSYYLALMLSGQKGPEQQAAAKKVKIVFPNQNNRGTHMNISGAGVTAYAPNKEHAIRFIEFLLSTEAQQHIVNTTFEYPIIDQVMPNTIMAAFGTSFKQDTTSVATYYNNQAQALAIMKKAGWR
jgi:iron(III) transport system substrate-binding protein